MQKARKTVGAPCERIVDVQVVLKGQIQYLDTGFYDPKVRKTTLHTSSRQDIAKFPQLTVIDEVESSPGSCRDKF